jgi:eukaryotic-like serine/threonine-protein kinase
MSFCASCGEACKPAPDWSCSGCQGSYLLHARYLFLKKLGSGGSGTTSLAEDLCFQQAKPLPVELHTPNPSAHVAIKEIPWRWSDDEKRKLHFFREVKILSELDNPQIPTLLNHFTLKEGRHQTLCIVQTYMDGPNLKALPKRPSQLEVWKLAEKLLNVLCYLHELSPPVVHRDIKPENVIALEEGSYALVDFGSVRDAATGGGASLTWGGSFGYMAPETLMGLALPQSDLYSLGTLLIWMLTREEPASLMSHSGALLWSHKLSLRTHEQRFLEKLLHSNPQKRWESARAARSALRTFLYQAAQPQASLPEELEQTLRRLLKEELSHSLRPKSSPHPPLPLPASSPSIEAEGIQAKEAHPLIPSEYLSLPRQRRGWWEARPPTPRENRPPPHPATIIFLMTSTFTVSAILFTLLLTQSF